MHKTTSLQLAELVHDRDLRPDAPIDDLLASIGLSGLEVPPLVRRRADGKYSILDGNRRTKACRQLGFTEVPCLLFEIDDKAKEEHLAELAAFHSNMARRDLAPSVLALELARYKKAYEALHPETGMGKARKGKKARHGGDVSGPRVERYTKAAEKIVSMKERSIQRLVAIGDNALPEVLRALDERVISLKTAEAIAQRAKTEQMLELSRRTEERARKRDRSERAEGDVEDTGAESAVEDPLALAIQHIDYAGATLLAPLTPGPLDVDRHRLLMEAQKRLADVLMRFTSPRQPVPAAGAAGAQRTAA